MKSHSVEKGGEYDEKECHIIASTDVFFAFFRATARTGGWTGSDFNFRVSFQCSKQLASEGAAIPLARSCQAIS